MPETKERKRKKPTHGTVRSGVLRVGERTKNGRIYTQEACEQVVGILTEGKVPVRKMGQKVGTVVAAQLQREVVIVEAEFRGRNMAIGDEVVFGRLRMRTDCIGVTEEQKGRTMVTAIKEVNGIVLEAVKE